MRIIGHARARLRPVLLLGSGIALLGLAGCELPEEPKWDVEVVAPFSSDPIMIWDFLPGIVQADMQSDPPVFLVDPQAASVDFNYNDMCALFGCVGVSGLPVPGFAYTDTLTVQFSEPELVAVEGVDAVLTLSVINGLGFEPLRSNVDTVGYIALAVRDIGSGTTIDSLFLSDATHDIGAQKDTTLTISAAELVDGITVVFHIVSPYDGQTISIDPSGASLSLAASVDGIEVAAATVVVASETLDTTFQVDFDQDAREEIMDRVIRGSYELTLIHDLQLDGTLEVSIAGSEADLFSGDPLREIRLTQLVLTPNLKQPGELSAADLELIAAFPDMYLGYRGDASGTGSGYGRPGDLSRFTPDQSIQAQLKVTAQVRIGG
ncbi:MAG: hypothetical protein JSV86_01615 [Gemmatimonadota bacterium]|nr:MAG: hypothetical protein JSV86_01615 [Gemmatimonadota bacterium]